MKYEDNAVDIEGLLRDFSINKKEFISFSDYYNDKFSEYGNEVYDDFKVRLVHLKYFLEDSWWNDRFYFLWKYFKKYGQIIDIGFSVPYLPIHLYRLGRIDELPNILYVDGNETSKILAEKICEKIGIEVDFVVGDVQMSATWEMIRDRIKSDSKLFCLFETIEHLTVADDFWKNIHAYKGS
ncbi:MAG: hypothetical protein NTZ38_00815, partial [Candidatus Taylorbacteria bacterium]|nr:hypothetical protein [Candidatus Taylorbacteria bacterium]